MSNILTNKETNDSIFNMIEDYIRFYSSFYNLGIIRKVDSYYQSSTNIKCLVIHSHNPDDFDADKQSPIDIPLIALLAFIHNQKQ